MEWEASRAACLGAGDTRTKAAVEGGAQWLWGVLLVVDCRQVGRQQAGVGTLLGLMKQVWGQGLERRVGRG